MRSQSGRTYSIWRVGVQNDSGPLSETSNEGKCPLKVRGDLLVHADGVRSSGGEGFDVALWLDDHQVNIDRQRRRLLDGGGDGRAKRDVRDEAPVHDVHVDPIRPRGFNLAHLLGEPPKVSTENGRGDYQVRRHEWGDTRGRSRRLPPPNRRSTASKLGVGAAWTSVLAGAC